MFLCGINDNVLISCSSYSGVYQGEARNENSTNRQLFFFGVGTKPKIEDMTVLHIFGNVE